MTSKSDVFYAKIMLFGEYSVICNSMGLTIPYVHFKGGMEFLSQYSYTDYDFASESNRMLSEYFKYLNTLQDKGELLFELDTEHFTRDLKRNIFFESTIPQGYGIGSSGALCAAIYERYASNRIKSQRRMRQEDMHLLKQIFAQMENYFHGVSSGIDPLICYMKYPLLITRDNDICVVGIPRNKFPRGGAIFLIDTGQPGSTQPLVNLFFKKCENDAYKNRMDEVLIPLNDKCINSLLEGQNEVFFSTLQELSEFQYNHFRPMIPEQMMSLWKSGLKNEHYTLKLCGSGGGGFILGFTRNFDASMSALKNQGHRVITVYKNR
jgi:mevalonate kinase